MVATMTAATEIDSRWRGSESHGARSQRPQRNGIDGRGAFTLTRKSGGHDASVRHSSSWAQKGPLLNERPQARPKKLADVFRAFLLFDLSFRHRLSGKLQHGRFLALTKVGQEYNVPIRKLERIMVHTRHVLVDLSKNRRSVTKCLLR